MAWNESGGGASEDRIVAKASSESLRDSPGAGQVNMARVESERDFHNSTRRGASLDQPALRREFGIAAGASAARRPLRPADRF